MIPSPRALRSIDQLAAALGSPALPSSARDLGRQVLERLSSPVRIAVLGRPEAGMAGLVNALAGGPVLPEGAALPPMELTFGLRESLRVVTGDGRQHEVDRVRFAALDPWSLAMVRITAPVPLLDRVCFLTVPLDTYARTLDAAIAWAARRADMAIWCTSALVETERALWRRLPDALMDHAFLAITGPETAARPADPGLGLRFRGIHRLAPDGAGKHVADAFRSALLDYVSTARREDVEGALVFLDRYQTGGSGRAPIAPEPARTALTDFDDLEEIVDTDTFGFGAPDDPAAAPTSATRTADDPAAEIISFIAAQEEDLARACDVASPDALEPHVREVLGLCTETAAACEEIAASADPALARLLGEAADLLLLMQLEATPGAVFDAVALLLQVRHECEERLCA